MTKSLAASLVLGVFSLGFLVSAYNYGNYWYLLPAAAAAYGVYHFYFKKKSY